MWRLQSGLIPSPQYHTEDWEQDWLQIHSTRKYVHTWYYMRSCLWAIPIVSLFTLQSQYLTCTWTSTSFSWRLHRTPAFWLPLLPFAVPLHLGQEAVRVREGTSTSGNDWVKGKGPERRRERESKSELHVGRTVPKNFHGQANDFQFQYKSSQLIYCCDDPVRSTVAD